MFEGCSAFASLIFANDADTTYLRTMAAMFKGCMRLPSVDASGVTHINLDGVSDTSSMFEGCVSLRASSLSGLDTSSLSNMNSMFKGCAALESVESLGLADINTVYVRDMSSLFEGCSGLRSADLTGFKTANVTNMDSMFKGCSSLPSIDLSAIDTANVESMDSMFADCSALESAILTGIDTTKLTSLHGMFSDCLQLTSIDLTDVATPGVTDMGALFSGCSKLAELDLSSIDSSKVTVMDSIFEGCEALDKLTLGEKFVFVGTASELPKAFWQAASTQKIYSSHQIATECKGIADTYAKRHDIKDEVPTITAGANVSWHRGMTSGAEFRSSAPLIIFTHVKVDGKVIESSKYDLREGSTIVTLKRDYLASLPNGKHTLEIVSATGAATTTFTVGDDPATKPDEPTPPGPDDPGPTPPGPDNPSNPDNPDTPDDPWQPPSNEGYPMYRLYNPNSGEHFYTSSIEERDHLICVRMARRGRGLDRSGKWGDPVYRLYNAVRWRAPLHAFGRRARLTSSGRAGMTRASAGTPIPHIARHYIV